MSLSCITTGAGSVRRKLCVPLHLRLTISWLGILLSFSSFCAALGSLLSPPSFSGCFSSSTRSVWALVLCLQSALHMLHVDGTLVWLESVWLHSRAIHWCCNPSGTTHLVRPCFEEFCTLTLTSCSVAWLCRGGPWLAESSLGLSVSRLRLLTPSAVVAFADQVLRGRRVLPLNQFRTLC